jgi:hypothetical protein
MLIVVIFATPLDVAVTVILDAPLGVDELIPAVVQPTTPPTVINKSARVAYPTRPCNGANLWRVAMNIARSPAKAVAVVHGKYGVQGLRRCGDGGKFAVVVIIRTVFAFAVPPVVPLEVSPGRTEQVVPDSAAGTVQV